MPKNNKVVRDDFPLISDGTHVFHVKREVDGWEAYIVINKQQATMMNMSGFECHYHGEKPTAEQIEKKLNLEKMR